jgi:hypothetical protein
MYLFIYSCIYVCIYLFILSYLYTQNIPQDGGWTNRGEKKTPLANRWSNTAGKSHYE